MSIGHYGWSGTPKNDNQYGARLWSSTTQSLTANTDVPISYNTKIYDFGGYFDILSPTKLTVPKGLGGIHILTFHGAFQYHPSGYRILRFGLNGANFFASILNPASPSFESIISMTTAVHLNGGDYVQSFMHQNAATLNSVTSAASAPYFTISRL